MKPNTIRRIDYYIGKPICLFLSFFTSSHKETDNPKKIVFLKFIEQGATILAFPAVKRAAETVGKENIYFCVFQNNRPILDILDIVPQKNIISLRDSSLILFMADAVSALFKLRKNKVDTVIDMEFFSRASAIFALLSGAKTRVGLHRFTSELPYRGNLMTHRIQYNAYIHVSQFYHLLVEATSKDPKEVPMMKVARKSLEATLPSFQPTQAEIETVLKKLQEAFSISDFISKKQEGTARIVILNPNAGDMLPLRKWESKKFITLGKKILEDNPNTYILISGAPDEAVVGNQIAKEISIDRVASLIGKTTLRELLTLYTLSNVLVTNDSGPGHFSSITDIQTVVLFGPETPQLFSPLSKNTHVIWKALACSPCVSMYNHRFSPCTNNICMQMITVEEVYEVVKGLL